MPESIYVIKTFGFPDSLEVLPLEINLRNKKILAFLDQLYSALSFYIHMIIYQIDSIIQYYYIYFFFLSGFSFTDTDDS